MSDVHGLDAGLEPNADFDLLEYAERSFSAYQEPPFNAALRFNASLAQDAEALLFHPSRSLVAKKNAIGEKNMSAMYELLRQLDEWRHLPDYQLERRVDVFFGMFLPKVIEKRFGVCVDTVVPEFPLRKGTLDPESSEGNQSVVVDFAVFARGQKATVQT